MAERFTVIWTKVTHDSFRGWVVTCPACGQLGALRGFWAAARMAWAHDEVCGPENSSDVVSPTR